MCRALSSIAVSSVLLCSSAFAAQGEPQGNPNAPGNPNIWAAVQDLQATQAGQNATLAAIQTSLNALTPVQSNVRTTPPILIAGQRGGCSVTNVGTSAHTVRVQAFRITSSGPNTLTFPELIAAADFLLPPGNADALFFNPPVFGYCKFTVLDGTRADIRAAISQLQMVDGNETTDSPLAAE
jgi:hypothetical protein